VKQNDRQELEEGNKERTRALPQIVLKQTNAGVQQLDGASEGAEDQ
jgi:hypothetical protein